MGHVVKLGENWEIWGAGILHWLFE